MDRDPAEKSESADAAIQDLARLVARHVESSDARLTRLEVNLRKLSDALGACVQSMNEFVDPSNARIARAEEDLQKMAQDVARLQQDLGALSRSIATDRGNPPPRG
jgi:hypothetical protein